MVGGEARSGLGGAAAAADGAAVSAMVGGKQGVGDLGSRMDVTFG